MAFALQSPVHTFLAPLHFVLISRPRRDDWLRHLAEIDYILADENFHNAPLELKEITKKDISVKIVTFFLSLMRWLEAFLYWDEEAGLTALKNIWEIFHEFVEKIFFKSIYTERSINGSGLIEIKKEVWVQISFRVISCFFLSFLTLKSLSSVKFECVHNINVYFSLIFMWWIGQKIHLKKL